MTDVISNTISWPPPSPVNLNGWGWGIVVNSQNRFFPSYSKTPWEPHVQARTILGRKETGHLIPLCLVKFFPNSTRSQGFFAVANDSDANSNFSCLTQTPN